MAVVDRRLTYLLKIFEDIGVEDVNEKTITKILYSYNLSNLLEEITIEDLQDMILKSIASSGKDIRLNKESISIYALINRSSTYAKRRN